MTSSEKITAGALLAVVVALLVVGVVSGTILRHVVQVVPVLLAFVVVRVRPAWYRLVAAPVLAFWLLMMVLIWGYLLGAWTIVTGHFTPTEIVLTIVIGIACVAGLVASLRGVRRAVWVAAGVALLFAALQFGAALLSVQPGLANR